MLRDRTLIGLNIAAFLTMVGTGMMMPLLPGRVIELTGSGAAAGYLASAFALSYVLLQMPIGHLADKLGFRVFLVMGFVLTCASGLLYYFTGSAVLLFFARFVQGVGEAPIIALGSAALSIKFPTTKGKMIGIYNAACFTGSTAGPILWVLLSNLLPGNEAFLVSSVTSIVSAFIIYLTMEDLHAKEPLPTGSVDLRSIVPLLASAGILIALMGIALYGAGFGVLETVVPAFLLTAKGVSTRFVGVFYSLLYGLLSISQIVTGPLTDRIGRKPFMVLGLMMTTVGVATFPRLSQPSLLLPLAVASLGLGVFWLASLAYLNEAVPNSLKGTISGAYYAFWAVGLFFGPIMVGGLQDPSGSDPGFYLFSLVLLVEVMTMVVFYRWRPAARAGG